MLMMLIKVSLALLVIYSHIAIVLGFDLDFFSRNGGGFAVNTFFLISGFFLSQKKYDYTKLYENLINRGLRLIPGGVVAAVLSSVVIALLSSSLTDFWALTVNTFYNGVFFLGIEFRLECAYSCISGGERLNASLWTMPYELYISLIYILVMSCVSRKAQVGLKANLIPCLTLSVLTILYCFTMFLDDLNSIRALVRLSFWFGVGAFVQFLMNSQVRCGWVNLSLVVSSLLLATYGSFIFTYPLVLILGVAAAGNRAELMVTKLLQSRPALDPTYGAYLIGFPVQQTLYWFFHVEAQIVLFLTTSVIAILYGLFSSYALESYKLDRLRTVGRWHSR